MAETTDFTPGGYRFIPGVFQYSAGVAALPGFDLVRVRFHEPVPLLEGFTAVAGQIRASGRPLTALAACELRSPDPFTDDGFRAFNETYVETLAQWGLYDRATRINPVARSNVCPLISPPAAPAFHAFTFTVASTPGGTSFVTSGSGEARDGPAPYAQRTVRYRDTSPHAMREKARFVLERMEDRLGTLGFSWHETTATQVYTRHDIHPFLGQEIVARGAARHGLIWHYCTPPIVDLEFETDCRGIGRETVI